MNLLPYIKMPFSPGHLSLSFCALMFAAGLFAAPEVSAQVTGDAPGDLPLDPSTNDSVMVFTSPRPLLEDADPNARKLDAWGFDLLFSQNGFGFGGFYRREFNRDFFGFLHLGASGAKNTDELEQFDNERGLFVPDKINRLFMFPVTLGLERRLFADDISNSFRPYVQAGAGTTMILATPYEKNFFPAFGDAKFFVRPSGFIGFGAYVGESKSSLTAVNFRYYYIPFGGDGLESVRGFPIENFGGIFLSLSVAMLN